MQDHDVVGIGNAIVDIIGRCDDAFLAQHGCSKGAMQLVDAQTVAKLYDAMGPAVEISGGSVANTMAGIASFGGKAGFIGKVAQDQFGSVFAHDIRAAGVTFTTPAAAAGQRSDRLLPDPGDAGRPAHHEHLPGREPAAGRRRDRRRADPLGAHRLPGGLSVRSAGGEIGLPAGGGDCRPRPAGRWRSACPTRFAWTGIAPSSWA